MKAKTEKQEPQYSSIDSDLREAIKTLLINKVGTDNGVRRQQTIEYIDHISCTFNPELMYLLVGSVNGTPVESLIKNLELESDLPPFQYFPPEV
jgi:hypothetical protein